MPSFDLNSDFLAGHSPAISEQELLQLCGKCCLVEYNTRKLLSVGDSREDAIAEYKKHHSGKKFYVYNVPIEFEESTV